MAYVLQGKARSTILDTYNNERQPIGKYVVNRANSSFRNQLALWSALGFLEPSIGRRKEILEELKADSEAGRARRAAFQKALKDLQYEHHALGGEMNQRYESSAIYLEDEADGPPVYGRDADLYYQPSTYPGCRLPHAWLNKSTPIKPISTHDLAGKGGFAIITGIGGKEAWTSAAQKVSEELGVMIRVTSVGWRQDYEDPFFDWEQVSPGRY